MKIEDRLEKLGIELPIIDESYYGTKYGKMKPHHRMGNWLCLSGQTPDLGDGTAFHPGVVGADVSVEDAYQGKPPSRQHSMVVSQTQSSKRDV